MRPSGPTFWRLGGASGWRARTASADLAVNDRNGLRLSANPKGLLSLTSSDGSLGQLTLPRGHAIDSRGTSYVLENGVIRRNGVPYLEFDGATSIAIVRDRLYVAIVDDAIVQVFDLQRRVIVDTLEHADWNPIDLAANRHAVWILDAAHGRVFRHAPSDALRLVHERKERANVWSRIVVDREGTIYLLNGNVLETTDKNAPPITDADTIRDRFDPPGFRADDAFTPLYKRGGQWQSKPLDSQKYHCQWHRLELQLAEFPPGSRVSVSTCTHEDEADVHDALSARWTEPQTIVAPLEKPPATTDFLVQSGQGRFLSIRIRLEADGFHTPAIAAAKVHYPRESYLEYLPATFSTDDESRVFLERFLSIFQTEWDRTDTRIDEIESLFDPDAVPEGPSLDYLASQWLGLPLEQTWTGKQKRRLLSAAPKIYPHRGQPAGLRDFIAVYLANISGLETVDVQKLEFPVIVEGFREREALIASSANARLGSGAPLWSLSFNRRLQLGVHSTEGEARLVSMGDPGHDVFARYAHRFRVYVPAAWVRNDADERMLRRAIEAEKPAHTQYELVLVAPRFRVGTQSTIGVDCILGDTPAAHVSYARLGYDTVLSSDAHTAAELVLG